MKILATLVIGLHGLIHLLGFLKGFALKDVKELSLPISKFAGLIWLLGTVLVVAYALVFQFQWRYGWIVGLAAVLVSQILIFAFWKDAKWGTLPNILILALSIMALGSFQFRQRVERETSQILGAVPSTASQALTEDGIRHLPAPVQRWLRRSGAVGRPMTRLGHLYQRAEMQLQPGQTNWLTATAEQYTTLYPPAFIWTVDAEMNRFVYFLGRDKFVDGKGEMRIQLNSLFPVVNEQGPKLDESSLQRFLGEMVWFPSMAVHPGIVWEALDDTSAQATLTHGGTRGSGIFHFSPQGDVVRYSALRYKDNTPDAARHEWVMEIQDYQTFSGIRVPARMTATWKLPEGDWTWLKLVVSALEFEGEE